MNFINPRFLILKFLRLILLLAAVAVLSFVLVSSSPVDPIDAYVGAAMLKISPDQRDIIAKRWGLDRPPVERFCKWAGQLAQGDFGISTIFNEPVLTVIGKRFVTSFWLMALAWSISGALGFLMGLVAGAWQDTLLDRAIRLYAYTLASTPTFWVGMVMLMIFSVPFLICNRCHAATELEDAGIVATLDAAARALGFAPQAQTLEVHGLCARCAQAA